MSTKTAKKAVSKTTKTAKPKTAKAKTAKTAKPKGIDTVFTLVAKNPRATAETVLKKAREIGVKPSVCSNNQVKVLYRLAHRAEAAFHACGRM